MKTKVCLRWRFSVAMACLGAIVGSCAEAVMPRDTIVFSHHLHREQGVDCAVCHSSIDQPQAPGVRKLMVMGDCADCHETKDPAGCRSCHSNPQAPDTYETAPVSHLRFSHKNHQMPCDTCHNGVGSGADITANRRYLPGHGECSACHGEELDTGRCEYCHQRLDIYPNKPEQLFSHETGFFGRHEVHAAGNEDTCATCHDQSFCLDCHNQNATKRPSLRYPDRVDRNFIHGGDWMSRHVLEGRAGVSNCQKCHGTSFCSNCHEQKGVGPALGGRSPHPSSSVWMAPGTATSHGRAARRRIVECAGCHDQGAASGCVECHRSGGVNPHLPGWRSPVPRQERLAHPMCRICHVD